MPRVFDALPIPFSTITLPHAEGTLLLLYLPVSPSGRAKSRRCDSGSHVRGYVVGDVNESNILVTPTALVTLGMDTDSFQVPDLGL